MFHKYDFSTNSVSTLVDLSNVPEEYDNFADVFERAKANTLASHWLYPIFQISLLWHNNSVNPTQKDLKWNFSDTCCDTFNKSKSVFISAPVLTRWIPNTPIIVETNESDYVIATILSIILHNGEIHSNAIPLPHLSTPGKLRTKPVSLTKHWDVYPKRG